MEIKIKGVTLKLYYSFFLIISFAVLYGYENLIRLLLFSALHEFGHLLALLSFGIKPDFISLSFYGAGMKYENKLSAIQEFLVIICGPLVNLLLFFVLADEVNMLLFLLNSFPAAPLDGGRIIKLLLPKAAKAVTIVSLLLLGIVAFVLLIKFKIYSLLMIFAYLLIFNIKEL